jgi:hypothetical protein
MNLFTSLVEKGLSLYLTNSILPVFQVPTHPVQSAMQNLTMDRTAFDTTGAVDEAGWEHVL